MAENYLFAIGSVSHAKLELFSLSTRKWKTSQNWSLNYPDFTEYYSFATFYYRYEFYVVGGRTKNKVLSVAAKFNPITEKWIEIGTLKSSRFNHRVSIVGDKLFIIGGNYSELKTNSLEYCDFINGFDCTFVNVTFEQRDHPILYGSYPSKYAKGI